MKIRVAVSIPVQHYTVVKKMAWLEDAIINNPSDLFLTPQEFIGGGSIRELCRMKGIATDDQPVNRDWLDQHVGTLALKHKTAIGFGASTSYLTGDTGEEYHYYGSDGRHIGCHRKIALPVQDNVALGGASKITPETSYDEAVKLIHIPELGLHIGTVFCWQVFFTQFWHDLAKQNANLVVHPIKFAPRAWYKKGKNSEGDFTRVGFTQNKGSELPEDDTLGWIRKLKYESEFKMLPIAVTCNTWDGGEKYLALAGFVDEVTHKTSLHHIPSTAFANLVSVTTYDPALFSALPNWNDADYGPYKEEFPAISAKIMMRKAMKIERNTIAGKSEAKLESFMRKPEQTHAQPGQQNWFDAE